MNTYLTFTAGYPSIIQSNTPQGILLTLHEADALYAAIARGDVVMETSTGYSIKPYVHTATPQDVDVERDRRIVSGTILNLTGYANTVLLMGDTKTRENLRERKDIAQYYMTQGDTTTPLVWRDGNDFVHLLTPPQMFELWLLGVDYAGKVYEHAWYLKDNPEGIPADYKDDKHWP